MLNHDTRLAFDSRILEIDIVAEQTNGFVFLVLSVFHSCFGSQFEIAFERCIFLQNIADESFADGLLRGIDIKRSVLTILLLTEEFDSLLFRGCSKSKERDISFSTLLSNLRADAEIGEMVLTFCKVDGIVKEI